MKADAVDLLYQAPACVVTAPPEALIAAGWGDTPRYRIPENWQNVRGPDRSAALSAARKKAAQTRLKRKGLR